MKKLLILLAAVFITLPSLAQKDYDGCHYYRNLHPLPKPKKLSFAEQKALQASILRSDTIDIQHYEIEIDVTAYNQQAITANTRITFAAIEPDRESILLDLYQLQVDSVLNEDGPMEFNYDGEMLQVYFDESPEVGVEEWLEVYYQGNPHQDPGWGGFYFESDYIYNLGIGLTTVPPNFGKVWYPCFDTFLERASYTYHVTSADGRVASCQGNLVDEMLLEGDTVRRTYDFPGPIPTYLSAIAVSEYESTDLTYEGVYGEVPVRLTSKPEHQAGMNNIFQEVGFAIDACEYWWGPNPWSRVGYVLTTDGALEIPTNIAYPQFMLNESLNSNGELISHELGHYWWGDVITMIEHNDMWFKEGPAEYSSYLFYEQRDGREAFIDVVKDNQLFVLEECHVQDEGFHPMSPMPDDQIYGRTTYQKGASVLHNLRAYLGDELFRQGMSDMQALMPYTNMDASMFRDSLSMLTGYDLTDYFDDHIFKPGFSVFVIDSVASTEVAGTYEHTLYLQQKLRECPEFYENVPLEVTAYDENWEKHNFMINADDQFSTATIETDFMPELIELNTNGLLLQSRMDTEFVIDGTTGFVNRPFVDFRLGCNEIAEGDSAFCRIEHVWAGPDNDNMADYIEEISSTHFWKVSGIFPESIEMDARVTYRGDDPIEDLDYDLVGFNEDDIMLVWRPNSSEPWIMYGDYELNAGNTFNGTGQMVIDPVRPGQYAFANGDVAAALLEQSAKLEVTAYPNPSDEQFNISWNGPASEQWEVNIVDVQGRTVLSEVLPQGVSNYRWDAEEQEAGVYLLQIRAAGTPKPAQTMQLIKR